MIDSEVLTTNGKEPISAYNWIEYVPRPLSDGIFGCYDSETGKQTVWEYEYRHNADDDVVENKVERLQAVWVYQWCLKIGPDYVCGRKIQDFLTLLQRLDAAWSTGGKKKKKFIIYIHNLSFDITFFIQGLHAIYNDDLHIFALNSRKYLYVRAGMFEFRCSYKLSNRGLAAMCKEERTYYIKAVGAVDYSIQRTPGTPLTPTDWYYQFSDCASLYNAVENIMRRENDTLSTIPLTSTGYVRRAMRISANKDKRWHKKYLAIKPTPVVYKLLKSAFVGGYTHCNMLYKTVQHDVLCFDAVSDYPAQMATELYPMGEFRPMDKDDCGYIPIAKIKQYRDWGFGVICRVHFRQVVLKRDENNDMLWNPYISASKCETIQGYIDDCGEGHPPLLDNGKVMIATNVTICCTDIDLSIINEVYDIAPEDVICSEAYFSKLGYLPDWVRENLKKWFYNKTSLKGAETWEQQQEYMRSKNLLNANYGLFAQDPVRDEFSVDFDTGEWLLTDNHTDGKIAEILGKEPRKAHGEWMDFLPYQWGVWTTAHARKKLFDVMRFCHVPLYSDTDSVKGKDWDLPALDRYNAALEQKARAAGDGFVLPKPKKRPEDDQSYSVMGVFEYEQTYDSFIALHAKCYAAEYNGKLHVTVAGVPEHGRGTSRAGELGDITQLANGFVFSACGGTRTEYIDVPHTITINGELIDSLGGCAILDSKKEINDEIGYLESTAAYMDKINALIHK